MRALSESTPLISGMPRSGKSVALWPVRRTVRVTYCRDTDLYWVGIVVGDAPLETLAECVCTEDYAELVAERASRAYGLDISRLDVD